MFQKADVTNRFRKDGQATKASRRKLPEIALGVVLVLLFAFVNSVAVASPAGPVETATFYATAATIVASFFLFNLALKNMSGVYYAGLFFMMLFLLWLLEGGTADLLPDASAGLHRRVEVSVGLIAAAFGYFTAANSIDPGVSNPTLSRFLNITILISLAAVVVAWTPAVSVAAGAANILIVGMFFSHVIVAATWRTWTDKQNRVALAVSGIVAFCIVVAAIVGFFVLGEQQDMRSFFHEWRILRVIFAIAALPTMGVIILGLVDMRRSRDAALEAALAAAKKDAETSAALLEMERDYARARDIAAHRTRALATASHDIRQPLASMRSELDALSVDAPPKIVDRLQRILDHLSNLTNDLSRTAKTPESVTAETEEATSSVAIEPIPAALVIETLERMFAGETKTKGIDFRAIHSSTIVDAAPTAILRIGANLVSNALQHSNATKILLGIKRAGENARLVIADNGDGFDENVGGAEAAFSTGAKSASSSGDGLGLSIVKELADSAGFTVQAITEPAKGSMFLITIPQSAAGGGQQA